MFKQKSPKKLPVFKGYTIDERLGEYRKVNKKTGMIEFIPFDSNKGKAITFGMNLSQILKEKK
jgi:hypothetical protein